MVGGAEGVSESLPEAMGIPVGFVDGDSEILAVQGFQVRTWTLRGGLREGPVLEHGEGDLAPVQWALVGREGSGLAGAGPGWVTVWDRLSGRVSQSFQAPGMVPWGLRATGDGRWLAVVAGERGIWLGDLKRGREVWVTGHRDMVKDVAFSADSTRFATASVDATIKVWSLPEVREIGMLRGHMTEVTAVSFSPDGVTLGSSELGHGLRFWHLPTLREVALIPMVNVGEWIAFSPDGRSLGVRLEGCEVRLLRAP